ncbi:hypothetical protein OB955_23130 [Halobacteria archaeon AArc-m2/3/4]|uniref:Uncharacterized protein n=1 Tax=Natronoglomus mannanivorans TaxID=2979990 RepID=A0AAP2YV12_9EURY|nr:hypothetical protein [Halobacteria archaeon AArc-xg1-1]MCU4975583.1 hypothetical protein [Halobacteria archaeon AArc-m2/3/4]
MSSSVPSTGLEVVFPFVASFLVAGAVCLAYAVAADANAREEDGASWAFAAVVAAPFVLPLYAYYQRRRFLPRRSPPTRRERVAGTVGVGTGLAVVVTAALSPPDPFSMLATFPVVAVVTLPVTSLVLYSSRLSKTPSG